MDVEELRSGGAMHVILLLFCGKSSKDSLARFLFFSSPSYLVKKRWLLIPFGLGWGCWWDCSLLTLSLSFSLSLSLSLSLTLCTLYPFSLFVVHLDLERQ